MVDVLLYIYPAQKKGTTPLCQISPIVQCEYTFLFGPENLRLSYRFELT